MRLRHWEVVLASVVWMGAVAAVAAESESVRMTPVAADRPIPVADFFRPDYMLSPTINGSGSHLAAAVSGGGDRFQLLVIDRLKGSRDSVAGGTDMDIHSPRWLADDRISYELSTKSLYRVAVMVASLARPDRSYPIYQYGGGRIIGVPPGEPMRPLIWAPWDERGLPGGVLELDANRKSGDLINLWKNRLSGDWNEVMRMNEKYTRKSFPDPGRGLVQRYLTDANQQLAAAVTVEGGVSKAHYWTGEVWGLSPLDLDRGTIVSAGNARDEVLVSSLGSEGEPGALHFADLVSGEMGEAIFRNSQYDFHGSIQRDPKSRTVVGLNYDEAAPRVVWFDDTYAALQKTLDASFPGKVVRVIDSNEKATVLLLKVSSDRHPGAFYVIDLGKHSIDLIAESRPWLDPQRLQPRQIIKFKTAEGLSLDAYLTLPAGASKANPPPLVVLPHDGPWSRDRWAFDAPSQFLASRGYAVLQPNYRGSPGYDWKFARQDRWDFLKMHNDVTQAARQLIAAGWVDGDRVAIAGGGFGAYLALMGAVNEPDLYRCALAFNGLFDWEKIVHAAKLLKHERSDFQILLRHLGDPADNPELFARISPARRVATLSMPVLIAYAKNETFVSAKASSRLVEDLKRHGLAHESLILNDDGHGSYRLENAVEYHAAMEAFLAKHL